MLDRLRRPDPVLFMIVALMCAAALVVYLQHRALDALDRQTSVILQKVAEQTVTAASQELRRAFDGPVFETLASLNHPSLVANRLDMVATEYAHGLQAYPQVERFFVWRGTQEAARPEEVLFYGGNDPRLPSPETAADAHTLFRPDPVMGKLDVMIVDVMLPGMSGFEVCREVRARGLRIPVIMLTARSEEADRVIGLDLGADDYVTKPFSIRELLARVRAQLRRTSVEPDSRDEFVFGDVRVYTTKRLVTRRGVRLDMSNREFELLRYFLAHRGEVVSREQLLRDVWGYNQVVVTRTVDNFVAKLRLHIEPKPHDPRYLVTVHGSGYQLIV